MCGRFTLAASRTDLQQMFPLFEIPELEPRYNIAPTQPVLAARIDPDSGDKEISLLMWGLVPSWSDDPKIGGKMINARAETVTTKPSYRSAFRRRRCLIPTSGYYEWQKVGSRKQPYFIHMHDEKPFAFAGLWEHWERDGNALESCTIITTAANDALKEVHDRMPVIIDPRNFARWLDVENDTGKGLDELLVPFDSSRMTARKVSTHVNNPRHEDARCIEAMED